MKVSSIHIKKVKKEKRKSSISQELIDKFLPIVKSVKLNYLTIIQLDRNDDIMFMECKNAASAIRKAKKVILECGKIAKRYFVVKKVGTDTLTLRRLPAKLVKAKLKKQKVSKAGNATPQPKKEISAKAKKTATKAKARSSRG